MSEGFAVWQGVGFGNCETGAGDIFFDVKTFGKATNKSSLAGTDIANKFYDTERVLPVAVLPHVAGSMGVPLRDRHPLQKSISKVFAEVEHFLFGSDFHCIIIT